MNVIFTHNGRILRLSIDRYQQYRDRRVLDGDEFDIIKLIV